MNSIIFIAFRTTNELVNIYNNILSMSSQILQTVNQANNLQIVPQWQNNLDKEPVKPVESKKVITKIEYKTKQKIQKEVEVRTFVIKRKVTKDYLERQAKLRPFGIGNTEDDLRQNVNLTSVQRENVWHPYYEVKLEEEDFKEKYQRQRAEKRETEMMNKDIAEIESKLKSLEEKERQEAMQQMDAANGIQKKSFNLKDLQARKREEEKFEQSIPVDDPYTIKLRSLTNDTNEDDIFNVMKKFGEIVKVKIPQEELRNGRKRGKGFAFVTFKTKEAASKAIEEGEIAIEFATLQIERALKAPPRQQDSKYPSEFDQLKRNTMMK